MDSPIRSLDPDTALYMICASQPGTAEASRAFGELIERHHEYTIRRLRVIVGRREAPEDVAQQIYVELLETATHFDGEKWSFKQWLRRSIKHRGIDAWRKLRLRPRPFTEIRKTCGVYRSNHEDGLYNSSPVEAVDQAVSPEEAACRQELIARFWDYYNTRSPEIQGILRLVYVEGMSKIDAAAALGIHRDTLARQIDRLRAPLAAALGGSLDDMNFSLERRSKKRHATRSAVA